jgi:hypothetical protein
MKINIGPYVNWVGPYQIADVLKLVGVPSNTCYKIGDWLSSTWVNLLCEKIHRFKKRKIKIKIDKYDTWNMDHTLALIILPMLKQLKETKHGSPCGKYFDQTSNSNQGCFDFYAEGDDAAWEAGHKEWNEILDHIIWAFEQICDESNEDKFWISHGKLDLSPSKSNAKFHPVTWEIEPICDWRGLEAHQERIREGLLLFGKYYQGLWD